MIRALSDRKASEMRAHVYLILASTPQAIFEAHMMGTLAYQ